MSIRVGFIGAGAISEFHARAVKRCRHTELVGVVDLDKSTRDTFAQRHDCKPYESLEDLLAAGVDSVHVLTPPNTHAALTDQVLQAGCHVYTEKPLTTSIEDAEQIAATLKQTDRQLCVGHSLLFDPQLVSLLNAARSGALGEIVSVTIFRGSEYPEYRGGPMPPHYRDAGYPFRDLGVHCLYVIQELLGPIERAEGSWASHGGDRNLKYDEWQATVFCERGVGQLQISYNAKPMQSQVIVHGTKGMRRADLFLMFNATRKALPLPGPAVRVVNALSDNFSPLFQVPLNIVRFLIGNVRQYHGLQGLVEDFYQRLADNRPSGVGIEQALPVVRWTEDIARRADQAYEANLDRLPALGSSRILLTGSSGGLGRIVLASLHQRGESVRQLLRQVPRQLTDSDQIVIGNLGDPEAVERAVAGVDVIVHVGAAMSGGWDQHYGSTVVGTRNLIDAAKRHGVSKFIHISSMSVVDWAGCDGQTVDEDSPLEPDAEKRGAYTRAKLEAEKIVLAPEVTAQMQVQVLRPGQIFGPTVPLMTAAVGRSIGQRKLLFGDGNQVLPLIHTDDVVDAITALLDQDHSSGTVFQLVDDDEIWTQNKVLNRVLGEKAKVIRLPRTIVLSLGKVSEWVFALLKRSSPFNTYRLRSAMSSMRYRSDRARDTFGWKPNKGVAAGIEDLVATMNSDPDAVRGKRESPVSE